MMKIPFLLVVALAVVHCEIWNEPPKKYEIKTTYEYNYVAQILTGIPSTSYHYNGYLLKATIRIHMTPNQRVTLVMNDVKMVRCNDVINKNDPSVFIDENLFRDLDDADLQALILQTLTKPIQFTWHMGVISQLAVLRDDPFWSINIKKGLLTMLNVDLKPYHHYSPINPQSRGDFYEVGYEEGVEGMCLTTYNWNKFPVKVLIENPNEQVAIVVTRTKNLDECSNTPNFEYASSFVSDNANKRYNVTRDVVKAETVTTTNATYWKSRQFFFTDSITTSRYTFAPINVKLVSISTFVRQVLNFVKLVPQNDVDMMKLIHEVEHDLITEPSLVLRMPMQELTKSKVSTPNNVKEANKLLNILANKLQPEQLKQVETTEELPFYVQRFVRVLSTLSQTDLMQLHTECERCSFNNPFILTLFHDLLSSVGTIEALQTCIKATILRRNPANEDDLSVARSIRGFGQISSVYFPEMIDVLIDVASKPILYQNHQRRETYKAVLTTISTLTNTYLSQHASIKTAFSNANEFNQLSKRVLNFYLRLLKGDLQIPILDKHELAIALVKALGNSGIRESLQHLEEIINSEQTPTSVKIQCVYALSGMAVRFAGAIQRDLMPIVFDVTRDAELRMVAFMVVMKSRPSMLILKNFAHLMRREPVLQVKTFMFSFMNEWTMDSQNGNDDFRRNISQVLETVDQTVDGIQYSHVSVTPIYGDALFLENGIIWTPQDFLPRSVSARLLLKTADKRTSIIEMGLRTEGLQNLLTKLLGPNGKIYTVERMEEIIRQYEPRAILNDPNFMFYLRLFESEIGFWMLDLEWKEMLLQGIVGVKKDLYNVIVGNKAMPVNFQRTYFMDAMKRIPTTFGAFFSTNITAVVHADLRGEINFKRSIFDRESTHIQINTTPTIISRFIVECGVEMTLMRAFTLVSAEASTPNVENLTFNVVYNKQTNDNRQTGLRIHMADPIVPINPFFFRVAQKSVLLQTNLKANEFNVEIRPVVMMYETETIVKAKIAKPETVQFVLPINDVSVKVEHSTSLKMINELPVHNLLRGYQMLKIHLQPTNPRRTSGMEFNLCVTRNESKEELPTINMKITKRLFEPTKVCDTSASKHANNNEIEVVWMDVFAKPVNTGNQENPGKSSKVLVKTMLRHIFTRKEIKYNAVLTMNAPTDVVYNPNKPLQIQVDDNNDKTIFRFGAKITTESNEEIISSKAFIDMDEESRLIRQRIIKNPTTLGNLNPMIGSCVTDLKEKFVNTPSCFLAWRFLNLLNRIRHVYRVNHKLMPPLLRTVLVGMLELKANNLLDNIDGINIMYDQTISANDVTVYRHDIIMSPLHPRVFRSQILLNDVLLTFNAIFIPHPLTISEHYPLGDPMRNNIRSVTNNAYPAICMVRRGPSTNAGRVLTFDRLYYNVHEVVPNKKVAGYMGRVILAQDVDNTFQVSAVRVDETPVIQILTQHPEAKMIQMIKKSENENKIIVNNKVVALPYNVNVSNGYTILKIEMLPNNVFEIKKLLRVVLPLTGVTVLTDLNTICDIELDPFYHSNIRGVCGDFDGETMTEMKTADCKGYFYVPGDIYKSCDYNNVVKQPTSGSVEDALKSNKFNTFRKLATCDRSRKLKPVRTLCNFLPQEMTDKVNTKQLYEEFGY